MHTRDKVLSVLAMIAIASVACFGKEGKKKNGR